MDTIPPLGWAAIAVIVVITLVVNVGMLAMLRQRSTRPIRMPRTSQTAQTMQKIQQVLRDPFKSEREPMDELSKLVDELQNPPKDKPNP